MLYSRSSVSLIAILLVVAAFGVAVPVSGQASLDVGEGSARQNLFRAAYIRVDGAAAGWSPTSPVFVEGPGEMQTFLAGDGTEAIISLHEVADVAYAIHGAIYVKYAALGRGLCSILGYPVSDETSTVLSPYPWPEGTMGRRVRFESGAIYHKSTTGDTFEVHGRIYEYYKQDDVAGWHGFPQSDVYEWANGERLDVEDGINYPPYGSYIYADAGAVTSFNWAVSPPLLDGYYEEGLLWLGFSFGVRNATGYRLYKDTYDPATHTVVSEEMRQDYGVPYEETGLDPLKGYVYTVAAVCRGTLSPRTNAFTVNMHEPCVVIPTRLCMRAERLGGRQSQSVQVTNYSDAPFSSAITSTDPRFTVVPAAVNLAPGETAMLMVTFEASESGNATGSLVFDAGGPEIFCQGIGVGDVVIHVNPGGSDSSGDGSSALPFGTIQYALDHAPTGGTVLAACGSYNENAIWMRQGVSLRGESGQSDCVQIGSGPAPDRVLYCLGLGADVVVQGVTIAGGNPPWENSLGQWGAGAFVRNCRMRFEDCRFSGNSAGAGGGGLYLVDSRPTFLRTEFYHNAAGGGGAIYCAGSAPAIDQCTFFGNSATEGGAIYGANASFPPIANSTFVANWGAFSGPAISGGGITLTNSILACNTTDIASASISGSANLYCCDVWGNQGGDYNAGLADQFDINGNFSLDPRFIDRAGGDLRLALGSPCAPGAPENGQCGIIGSRDLLTQAGIRIRVIESIPGGSVVPVIARIAGTATSATPFVYIIDGYATFTDAKLMEFFGKFSEPEDRIERIEIMDDSSPHRVVGHIGFKYTYAQQQQGVGIDCFLFLHDGGRAEGAGEHNWEYYDDDEYPVTMLVPPGGDLQHVDGGDDWPVIFIHGVSGTHGYWENTPDSLPRDAVDSWEFCYPYDQDIGELAGYLRYVVPLLLDGPLVDVPAYENRRAGLVTHSMGGLVVRQALRNSAFADRIERVLMIAPPNHGSHLSWRMNIDDPNVTWFMGEFLEIMPNKDPDAPAYAQMSPASDFLNELNRNSVPSLAGRSVSQSYLVVAGVRDVSTYPQLHREIQSQDDGVVAASSASLTGWSIPLALVDHDHGGIHNSAPAKALMPWIWGGLQAAVDEVPGVLCVQQAEGAEQCDDVPGLDTGIGMMTVTISDPPDNAQYYRIDGIVNGSLQLTMNGRLDQVDSRRELRRTTHDGDGFFSLCRRFEYHGLDIRELAHWIPAGTYPVVLIEENRTSISTDVIRINHLSTAVDDIIRSPWSNLAYSAPSISNVSPTAIGIAAVYDWTVDSRVDTLVLSLSAANIDPQTMPDRMELTDPHGNVIDAAVAGSNPDIDFVAESVKGPIRFVVRQPEPGAWTVRHAAGLTGATLTAGVYSPVRMQVALNPLEPVEGDSLVLDVEVLGADTLPLRTVTADVIRTSEDGLGTVDLGTLDFAWSTGDLWRRVLTNVESGTYEIVVTLNGTDAEGQTVTRDVTKSVWVGSAPNGASGIGDDLRAADELPHKLRLVVSPNPFNASTGIHFELPRTQHVDLAIYAIDGRRVVLLAANVMEVGPHRITWHGVDSNGRPAASGVYFVVLNTADGRVTSKTALLK